MAFNDYLRLIWGSKRWLLLFAVAAAVVVYLASSTRTDSYESGALGQIISTSQATGDILSEEQLLSLSNVYHELADTRTVLDLAHNDPAVKGNESEFDDSVSVSPESRIGVLEFIAVTDDPEVSAGFANAYAQAFQTYLGGLQVEQLKETLAPLEERIEQVGGELENASAGSAEATSLQLELEALQSQLAEQTANPGDSLRIVERAVPEATPVAPKPKRDAILAFIVALVLGAVAVYLRDFLFDRYGSAQDASRDLGLPLLGEIPRGRGEVPVEAFRRLRAATMFTLERNTEPRINASELGSGTLLVTGPESGCGKSYVSANLSRTLASEGRRVSIVDGDLRRPTLHEVFGRKLSPGLSDLLLETNDVTDATIEVHIDGTISSPGGSLRLLPAGAHAEAAVESLSSPRMRAVVEGLQASSDVVVFDSPPAPIVVDPVVLARYADGVVFVIDSRRTRRREARKAIEALRSTGAPLLGFAYNRSAAKQTRYDSYRPVDPRSRAPGRSRETPV
jgi:capsular exopolysaccharide synthesis family protein